MRRRRAGLTLVIAVLAAACGGAGGTAVRPSQLPRLVLQPADLGGAFTRFDVGRQAQLDRVPGPRADPTRFGREGGWKARYNRPGTPTTRGPLVVESRADVFRDAGGATKDLAAYRAQFRRQPGAAGFRVARLGRAATAIVQDRPGTPAARFVSIAWRDGNVTASVTANGFAPGLRTADAVALARAQERRIAAALRR
jgi:hypothetical protein